MHDHWPSYLTFTHCTHAFCNAQHLRDMTSAFHSTTISPNAMCA
ncbi:MAG: hypothetical protein H0T73_08800 [Ardenticatenales bacterium]|nr:hypothetical protein [Ardenticatenales bacterium]